MLSTPATYTLLCLLAVKEAFRTAKWTAGDRDPSISTFPATSTAARHVQLAQTAALMVTILGTGSNKVEASQASSNTGSKHVTKWPVPSSKEWTSTSTVTMRVVQVLRWVHDCIDDEGAGSTTIPAAGPDFVAATQPAFVRQAFTSANLALLETCTQQTCSGPHQQRIFAEITSHAPLLC